ncbi:MAG TPA: helix-turn-helix transcriptional regulator, partial [Thermomonospora sp.]|nr:helix-turn-helix transcriptional regulator [Thermomonospora sp.]
TATTAIGHWALGLAALGAGEPERAVRHLQTVTCRTGPAHHFLVGWAATPDLVEGHLALGQEREAALAFQALEDWHVDATVPHLHAMVTRTRALLSADPTAREHLFREAVAAARTTPFDLGRAELLFGKWLRRARRVREARAHLHTALTTFRLLDAEPWVQQTLAELRSSGDPRTGRPADSAGTGRLTPQELQIARFAAQGLSNPEIAARLFISPRTVRYHLSKIFGKVGVTSRHQLRDVGLCP